MPGWEDTSSPRPTHLDTSSNVLREVAKVLYLFIPATLGLLAVGWVLGMWTRRWTLGGCQECGYSLVCAHCQGLTEGPCSPHAARQQGTSVPTAEAAK